MCLPFYDMSKNEIREFYLKAKEQLFDEHS